MADTALGPEFELLKKTERLRIERAAAGYIADANAIARARGEEGASARDLALIHRWASNEYKRAIAQFEAAARDLISSLGYDATMVTIFAMSAIPAGDPVTGPAIAGPPAAKGPASSDRTITATPTTKKPSTMVVRASLPLSLIHISEPTRPY